MSTMGLFQLFAHNKSDVPTMIDFSSFLQLNGSPPAVPRSHASCIDLDTPEHFSYVHCCDSEHRKSALQEHIMAANFNVFTARDSSLVTTKYSPFIDEDTGAQQVSHLPSIRQLEDRFPIIALFSPLHHRASLSPVGKSSVIFGRSLLSTKDVTDASQFKMGKKLSAK